MQAIPVPVQTHQNHHSTVKACFMSVLLASEQLGGVTLTGTADTIARAGNAFWV